MHLRSISPRAGNLMRRGVSKQSASLPPAGTADSSTLPGRFSARPWRCLAPRARRTPRRGVHEFDAADRRRRAALVCRWPGLRTVTGQRCSRLWRSKQEGLNADKKKMHADARRWDMGHRIGAALRVRLCDPCREGPCRTQAHPRASACIFFLSAVSPSCLLRRVPYRAAREADNGVIAGPAAAAHHVHARQSLAPGYCGHPSRHLQWGFLVSEAAGPASPPVQAKRPGYRCRGSSRPFRPIDSVTAAVGRQVTFERTNHPPICRALTQSAGIETFR
jgi:hypothetical protein